MIPFGDDAPADRAPIEGESRRVIVPADIRAEAHADNPDPAPAGASSSSSAPSIEPPIDYAAEAKDLVEFAYAMVQPLYPSLDQVYTAEARSRISSAAAPLMAKYSFNLGRLGPELAFAVTVLPLVAPTMQAIRHDRQQQKQAAQAASTSSSPITSSSPAAGSAAAANDAGPGGESPLGRFPGQTTS
jgi:hypothetical protein